MFQGERFEPQSNQQPSAGSLPLGAQGTEDAQIGRRGSVALDVENAPQGDGARENLLRLWRSAAQVVRTDPVAARRAAYEAAIDEVLAQLPPLTSFEALMDSYGAISRAAIEVMATRLRRDGRLVKCGLRLPITAATPSRQSGILPSSTAIGPSTFSRSNGCGSPV